MTEIGPAITRPASDDIAVWPAGTCPHLGEIWNGGFSFLSDDDAIVDIDDRARLKALGIEAEMGEPPLPDGPPASGPDLRSL
ncbi:hypothetical protein [Devosia sp. A369]